MSSINFASAIAAGVAGSGQAQKASAKDQNAQDAVVHERKTESKENAIKAEGVGSNDDESEASNEDRDADGRRAWEWNMKNRSQDRQRSEKSIDPSGQTGNSLDLSG